MNPSKKNTSPAVPTCSHPVLLFSCPRSSLTAAWPPRWLNGSVTSESSSISRWSGLHGRLSARLSHGWFDFTFSYYTRWFANPYCMSGGAINIEFSPWTICTLLLQQCKVIYWEYCSQPSICFLTNCIINKPVYVSVLPRDGAARLGRDSQLRVGRDTELYRILNMHYNKSNVYQVRWLYQCVAWSAHCSVKLLII